MRATLTIPAMGRSSPGPHISSIPLGLVAGRPGPSAGALQSGRGPCGRALYPGCARQSVLRASVLRGGVTDVRGCDVRLHVPRAQRASGDVLYHVPLARAAWHLARRNVDVHPAPSTLHVFSISGLCPTPSSSDEPGRTSSTEGPRLKSPGIVCSVCARGDGEAPARPSGLRTLSPGRRSIPREAGAAADPSRLQPDVVVLAAMHRARRAPRARRSSRCRSRSALAQRDRHHLRAEVAGHLLGGLAVAASRADRW
jgi:hypothetical protein